MSKCRLIIAAPLLLLLSTSLLAQNSNQKKPPPQIKQYWFVLLTKGPNRNQDSTLAASIQEGHMSNMDRLWKEGKLKVAGPFGEEGDWQGIFIFDGKSKEEVELWLQTDPAIKAGRLNYQIKSWYTEASGSFTPGIPKKNKG
jgi:uncharacterized protein